MNFSDSVTDTRSEKKARKFHLYKWIALFVLVAVLIGGLIVFENDITVENLRYLIKYLDFSSFSSYSEEVQIHYHADPSNRFYVFRGDLARINQSGVTLYDRRGTAVMTDSYKMTNPVAVCGEKYLLVYDLGGNQLRMYSSFSFLYEKTYDYPLQSVDMNASGDFCVVTAQRSYHSAVFVYNDDFEEIHRYVTADRFAVNASISDNDRLLVSTIFVNQGNLMTELLELKVGEKEPVSVFSLVEQMPVLHSAQKKDTLLLTDQSLICVEGGKEVHSATLPEEGLKMVSFGEKYCALVQDELSVGINYRIRIFDRQARELYSHRLSVQIRDVEILDDRVYVLTHTNLLVISLAGEVSVQEYTLVDDPTDLGVLSEDVVILCSDSLAKIHILNEREENV